jgi:hypothetical protein
MTIISGGQTGVDRAALDVALALGFPTGGWVPKGRLAEDGRIPDRYPGFREAPTADYAERTVLNVRDADATLIFSHGPLTGGSLHTLNTAVRLARPALHVDLSLRSDGDAVSEIRTWLLTVRPNILNVAGPRASSDAGIAAHASIVLRAVLGDVNLPVVPTF